MMKYRYSLAAQSVLFALIIAGCGPKQSGDEDESSGDVQPLVKVTTMPIVEGNAVTTVQAFGRTDALHKEKIVAPVAGRVLRLRVLEGARVRPGETLAVILTKESQAAIAGAEAMLHSARTDEERKEAGRALQLARSSESTVSVTPTFAGVVASRSVSEGELVTENEELFTVVDLATLDFVADVPLPSVDAIREGMRGVIDFPSLPGQRFTGVVDALLSVTDPETQTVRARLRFTGLDDRERSLLRIDMPGSAGIVTAERGHALFVPKAALLRDDETNSYSVVVVTPDSLSLTIPVRIGSANDSLMEVQSPQLKPGMPVVVAGNYALTDSTRVLPAERPRQ